jgi:hypothetical protein
MITAARKHRPNATLKATCIGSHCTVRQDEPNGNGCLSCRYSIMRAVSFRQPFAEMIPSQAQGGPAGDEDGGRLQLSGHSRPTRIIGERFWIYASICSGFGGKLRKPRGHLEPVWFIRSKTMPFRDGGSAVNGGHFCHWGEPI